jgi:hypothetical protein
MAQFQTLDELTLLVRRKADIENSGLHVSDDEIKDYINSANAMLWSLLIDGTDGTLFAKVSPDLVKVGDNSYRLPADFFKLVEISVNWGNRYYPAVEADPQEYGILLRRNLVSQINTRYFFQFNSAQGWFELFVFPEPNAVSDILIRYIPAAQILSLGTNELKLPSNWYEWVVFDAAIQCMIKEESDPSVLIMEREKRERRLKDDIRSMSPATPGSIRTFRVSSHLIPPSINGF